jgi:hypothetical protein
MLKSPASYRDARSTYWLSTDEGANWSACSSRLAHAMKPEAELPASQVAIYANATEADYEGVRKEWLYRR